MITISQQGSPASPRPESDPCAHAEKCRESSELLYIGLQYCKDRIYLNRIGLDSEDVDVTGICIYRDA